MSDHVEDAQDAPAHTTEQLEQARAMLAEQTENNDRRLQLVKPRRISLWHRYVVAPLKRSHWIFRLGDFVVVRLERQDHIEKEFGEMKKAMIGLAGQHQMLVSVQRGMLDQLAHHEKGPLKASREEFDRRRNDGIVRPQRVHRHRTGSEAPSAPASQPDKKYDAAGNVVDAEGPKSA